MINLVQNGEPFYEEFYETNNEILSGDVVSIKDVSHSNSNTADEGDNRQLLDSSDGYDSDHATMSEEEL